MCVVCNLYGFDRKFLNGKKLALRKVELYKVFSNQKACLNLCFLHDIEIFQIGEVRFLQNYLKIVEDISQNKEKYSPNQLFDIAL